MNTLRKLCNPPLLAGLIAAVSVLLPHQSAMGETAMSGPEAKAPNYLVTQQRSFDIPFSVGRGELGIVEVILLESQDQGRSWREYARQSPALGKFPFVCQNDGQYWFVLQTINRDRRKIPAQPRHPELCIVVDTKKPELEFDVRPDAAGRIVGQWTASDANLDPNSLSISYQSATRAADPETEWITVPTNKSQPSINDGTFQDQLAWWPEISARSLQIQATIRDKAGNSTSVVRQMTRPLVASNAGSNQTGPSAATNESTDSQLPTHGYHRAGIPAALLPGGRIPKPNRSNGDRNRQPNLAGQSTGTSTVPQPPAPLNRIAQLDDAAADKRRGDADLSSPDVERTVWRSRANNDQATRVAENSTHAWRARVAQGDAADRSEVIVGSGSTSPSQKALAASYSTGSTEATQQIQMAPRENTLGRRGPPAVPSEMVPGRVDELKRMARHSNSTRFQLEYEIDAVGPEGVRDIELWITPDGGKTWRRATTDEDQRSPMDVEVSGEGVFGFRIVVISNEGLRTRSPRSGDPADLWVNVDITKPDAKIIEAPYGRGAQAGQLLIRWSAADENLALRPIKLQFSPRASGPWTTIEEGVRNEGQFAWKPGMEIPERVYLRLEARDLAGNVQVHQLDRPVDVSGLIPRGHIRGITPLTGPPQ